MSTCKECVAIVLTLLVGIGRVSATPQSAAERLVDRLPDRTLMVLAWSGGDQVGEDFRQTAVGRTLDEESIRSFVTDLKNAIWTGISAEATEPADKVALETVRDAWPVITKSPGAVVIVAGDPQADFAISVAIVLEAHKYQDKIEGMLTRVNAVIEPPTDVRVADVDLKSIPGEGLVWGWVGERFVIGLGDLTHLVRSLSTGKSALSDSETFRKRLAAVPGEREILLLYADVTAAARLVKAASSPDDAESVQKAEAVLTRLGLADVEAVLARVFARGPEFVVNTTVFAPAPRRGLWPCVEGQVGADRMKAVPANATMAGAGTFRIPAILPMITEAVRAVSPEDATAMTQSLDALEQQIDVPIRKDLLENFAGAYTYYVIPVENPMLTQGLVALLDVKDSATIETGLTKVEQWVKSKIPPNTISEKAKTFGDESVTLHVWNLTGLNIPAQVTWAVCKNKLVIELAAGFPGSAVDHLMAGGPSLADHPAFSAVAGTFSASTSHYSFSDDKARTRDGMRQLAMLWTVFQMAANQTAEITLPFLPPASDVSKHFGTTGSYTFTDEIGMHTRTVGSFPGGDPVFVTGGVAGLTSILLPSLSRAREMSKRLVSAANLKGIGLCCIIYANENDNRYPPNLQVFIDNGDMTPRQLLNPRVSDPDKPNQYVYIPGQTEGGAPDSVLAYANPAYVDEGINILFLDGHVEFVRGEEALAKIRVTYQKMGLDVPELSYAASKPTSFLSKFDWRSAGTANK